MKGPEYKEPGQALDGGLTHTGTSPPQRSIVYSRELSSSSSRMAADELPPNTDLQASHGDALAVLQRPGCRGCKKMEEKERDEKDEKDEGIALDSESETSGESKSTFLLLPFSAASRPSTPIPPPDFALFTSVQGSPGWRVGGSTIAGYSPPGDSPSGTLAEVASTLTDPRPLATPRNSLSPHPRISSSFAP